jgi:DNA-binding LacI/PurR family transcriptional regulator
MTTIKDVAAHAGVGVATVSRVLNGHPAVTPSTRARVKDSIAELDYHPNRAARALSTRRYGSIAVIVPFFTHPSSVERLRGVVDALGDSHYEVVLYNVDHLDRSRFSRLLRRHVADGLLVVSLRPTAEETRQLHQTGTPVMILDADAPGFPTVMVDDVEGGRMAGRHLLELGHHRVGFIGDAPEMRFGFTSSSRRKAGLDEVLTAAGEPLDPNLIREGTHGRAAARAMAHTLLDQPDPPTAVFAHSDTQALGVLEAASELGLAVPNDLSVVGFDDIEAADVAGLTTVRQPLFESGRIGATRLLHLLDHSTPDDVEHVELPLEIVVRRTTGRPARRHAHRGHGPASRRSAV